MKLIGIAAIIVALAVGYYFVIYVPQRDRENFNAKQMQILLNRKELNDCFSNAQKAYNQEWASVCKDDGKSADNCSLPSNAATELNNDLKSKRDDCFKEFPVSN